MFLAACGIPQSSDPSDGSVRLVDDHEERVPAPTTAVLPRLPSPPEPQPPDPSADSLDVGLVDLPSVVIT